MKFCRQCGNEIMDESVICPKCGCSTGVALTTEPVQATTSHSGGNSGLRTVAKIFMIIGAVMTSIYGFGIPLAWCIPMTIVYFGKLKRGEAIGTGFKVCCLLFVSTVGGILMLCDNGGGKPVTISTNNVSNDDGEAVVFSSNDETMSYAVEGVSTSGAGKAFSIPQAPFCPFPYGSGSWDCPTSSYASYP